MIIVDSARKHGITDIDIEYVFDRAIQAITLQEEPAIVMVFGFDTIGRGLEVGYIINDNGEDIIIHAMKIRPSYKRYLHEK